MVGLTGNNLAIGIALVLRDQFSAGARQATQSLTQLQSKADKAAMESARNMNAIGAGMGLAVLSGMREWLRTGLEFDKQMTYMYAVADKTSGITSKKMRDRAKDVGVQTMFSAQEVSEAMVVMAQAGQNTGQIFENIYATAVLGAATMSGVRESASVMNDVMIGFDIKATEANAMRVADIITQTINDSNIALDSYAETMKYTVATSKTLGVSLEELSAITSVLGNAGLKGSMAGTGTENMIRLLAIAAGKEEGTKQMDALQMMGLGREDIVTAEGNLRSLSEVFPKIGQGLQGMGNADRIKVMADLFNIRGARPGQILTFATGLEKYATALERVNNADGVSTRVSDERMGSPSGQVDQLVESIGNLKIAFTEALTPALQIVVPMLTSLFNLMNKVMGTNIGKLMVMVGTGFVLWKTASMGYRTILYSINLLNGQLGTSFGRTAATTVSGYNSMTSAALRYRTAAGSAGAAGGMAGGMAAGGWAATAVNTPKGKVYQNSRGQWVQVMPSGGHRFLSKGAGAAKWARASNVVGKASPYAMVGGLAMGAAQSYTEEGSGLNRGLGIGSTVLGGASMGAMLGSVVPGVGNVVGAIVGGVGGLLWGLYDDAKAEEERVKAAKEAYEADKAERPDGFDPTVWKQNAQTYIKMKPGETMDVYGTGREMQATSKEHIMQLLQSQGTYTNGQQQPIPKTQITINIDGKQMMMEEIQKERYRTFIDLGG